MITHSERIQGWQRKIIREITMIIVTGATGKFGHAVVERLFEKLPAAQVGVSVRDPEKARTFAERGLRVRRGDFGDTTSLHHAFEGASQVLVVSVDSVGEAAVSRHRNAVEAARTAGARRVLYTSHMASNPASLFAPALDHAATEAILTTSGMAFTSLRNGFYMESALMIMGDALETGRFVAPEDGPASWTATADLAEAAALTLGDESRFQGVTPPLTAPQALDLAGIAAIASELAGRPILRVTVTDKEYKASLVAHGVPEMYADLFLGMFAASRRGEFALVDPALERLLGRPPITMREFLAARVSG